MLRTISIIFSFTWLVSYSIQNGHCTSLPMNKRHVFCINCKYFYLPPNEGQTKFGKCTKFSAKSSMDILEHDVKTELTPYYYVNGIYMDNSTTIYQDAILCRMMPYLCGKDGMFFESNQIVE